MGRAEVLVRRAAMISEVLGGCAVFLAVTTHKYVPDIVFDWMPQLSDAAAARYNVVAAFVTGCCIVGLVIWLGFVIKELQATGVFENAKTEDVDD